MTILGLDSSSKYFSLLVGKGDTILASLNEPLEKELSSKIIPSIAKGLKKSALSLEDIDYFAVGLGPGSFTALRVGVATIKGLAFSQKKAVVGVSSLDIIAYGVKPSALCNKFSTVHKGVWGRPSPTFGGCSANEVSAEGGLAPLAEVRCDSPKLTTQRTIGIGSEFCDNLTICPVVDAKRFLVYSAIYKLRDGCLKRRSGYFLISIEELIAKLKMEEKVIFTGDGLFLYRAYLKKKLGKSAYFVNENLWYPKMESVLFYLKEKIDKKEFLDLHKIAPLYLYPKECQIKPLKHK